MSNEQSFMKKSNKSKDKYCGDGKKETRKKSIYDNFRIIKKKFIKLFFWFLKLLLWVKKLIEIEFFKFFKTSLSTKI